MLKPQDILVLLKLIAIGNQKWAYNKLAVELGMSPSEVHSAIKRALAAGLAIQKDGKIIPYVSNLEEFVIHGLKFVFVPQRGELLRGMVMGYAAAPEAARLEHVLYELLVLVDGIRGGRAREREIAIKEFKKRIELYDLATKS